MGGRISCKPASGWKIMEEQVLFCSRMEDHGRLSVTSCSAAIAKRELALREAPITDRCHSLPWLRVHPIDQAIDQAQGGKAWRGLRRAAKRPLPPPLEPNPHIGASVTLQHSPRRGVFL